MSDEPIKASMFMGLPVDKVAEAITFYQAYAHIHDTDDFRLLMLRAELAAREADRAKLDEALSLLQNRIRALENRISYNSGEATK